MADAPSGGGGSWSALEIILVIILAIGFLTQLQNGFSSKDASGQKEEKTSTAEVPCGLVILRPHSLEKVDTFVTLSGRVEGCDWIPTPAAALYAQVVDSVGRPLSPYTAVSGLDNGFEAVSFSTSIGLTQPPTTTKGFLILFAAQSMEGKTTSYRIPITFSK